MNKTIEKQIKEDSDFVKLLGLNYDDFKVRGEAYKGLFSPTVYLLGIKVDGCYSVVHKSESKAATTQAINEAIDNIVGSGNRFNYESKKILDIETLQRKVLEFLKEKIKEE